MYMISLRFGLLLLSNLDTVPPVYTSRLCVGCVDGTLPVPGS